MHMISKKDLNDAEMDTLTKSSYDSHNRQWRSADARRGNSVCQRIGFFLTMKVLENTPAVLSLGKLCDENGYSYEWINGLPGTRLRRLKYTLHPKGAWQQMARTEDSCHTNVSHKWLYHLDACAGSVLTPHDYITNVQKRLGNRMWTGFGQNRLCGSFLHPQLEHGETCSTAEATRVHYACVHAVCLGLRSITTEPRVLTATQAG